jgi:hypothetical protein
MAVIDGFGMLSSLGDTFQANNLARQQQEQAALSAQQANSVIPGIAPAVQPPQSVFKRILEGLNPSQAMAQQPQPARPSQITLDRSQPISGATNYFGKVAQIESGGDPNAANGSHKGLFQFGNNEWSQYAPPGSLPSDPRAQMAAIVPYTEDHNRALSAALGRTPTAGELYLAHQQGVGGALKLLQNPDATPASLGLGGNVANNGGDPNAPAANFINKWTSKFAGVPSPFSPSGETAIAQAASPPQTRIVNGVTQTLTPVGWSVAPSNTQALPPPNVQLASAVPTPNTIDPNDPPVAVPGFHGTWTRAAAAHTDPNDTSTPDASDVTAAQHSQFSAASPSGSPNPAQTADIVGSIPNNGTTVSLGGKAYGLPQISVLLNSPYPGAKAIGTQLLAKMASEAKASTVETVSPSDYAANNIPANFKGVVQKDSTTGKLTLTNLAPRGGINQAHVVGPGGALVDPTGKVLYQGKSNVELDDATTESMAQRLADGDPSVLMGLGRGAQGAANIIAIQKRAAQIANENGGPQSILNNKAGFAGQMAGARTSGAITAKIDTYANTANSAADIAKEASDKVDRTQWVPFNRLLQMGQAADSNPELAAFKASILTLANEYSRATGGGTMTVAGQQHALDMISTAQDRPAFNAVIGIMKGEIQRALEASHKVLKSNTSGGASSNVANPVEPLTPQSSAQPKPSGDDVRFLIAHPDGAAQFEAHFGIPAARFLGPNGAP